MVGFVVVVMIGVVGVVVVVHRHGSCGSWDK